MARAAGGLALFLLGGAPVAARTAAAADLDTGRCTGTQEEASSCDHCTPSSTDGECIDGKWGPWGAWQACSTSCGFGLQRRSRREERTASACGLPAEGSEHEFRSCNGEATASNTGASASLAFLAKATSAEAEKSAEGCSAEASNRVCSLGDWSEWVDCEPPCAAGLERVRRRSLVSMTTSQLLSREFGRLEAMVQTLSKANVTLIAENEALAGRIAGSTLELQHYQEQASQALGLEQELAQTRKENDNLREQNMELIEKVLASKHTLDMDAAFTTRLERAKQDLERRGRGDRGHVMELEGEIEDMKQENLELRTEREALKSEVKRMHGVADRLRLALPVGIGAVVCVSIVGALLSLAALRQMNPRNGLGNGLARRLDGSDVVEQGMNGLPGSPRPASPRSRLGYGELSGDGSPMRSPQSPTRSAQGTLLPSSSVSSPKACRGGAREPM